MLFRSAVGGPRIWNASELGSYGGQGAMLPARDVAISPSQTLSVCGTMPMERLENWSPSIATPRRAPDYHPADDGQDIPTLYLSAAGRRALFTQLLSEFPEDARLSFAGSIPCGAREASREGELTALEGVQVLATDGTVLKTGSIDYFYDEPSRQLFYWWDEEGLPRRV